jgi:hypothetical protein
MPTPQKSNVVPGTNITDISGRKFGRWMVLDFDHKVAKNKYWRCRCDCGTLKVVGHSGLVSGASTSCGCYHRERSAQCATHGMSKHPAYRTFQHMHNRCYNKNNKKYEYYGSKGVVVCQKWHTFEGFWEDMRSTWAEGLSLERLDSDGNYEKDNCKWATWEEQCRNTGRSIKIETPWGLMNLADVADKLGISRGTLQNRYHEGLRGADLLFTGKYHKSRPYNATSTTTLSDLGLDD